MEQANVSGPKQVEIEAKFVEINQNNLKELGFDWLLGPIQHLGTSASLAVAARREHRRRSIRPIFHSSIRTMSRLDNSR